MKARLKFYSIIAVILSCSSHVIAKPQTGQFEMFVFKNTVGSKQILKGNYQKGVKQITRSNDTDNPRFELSVGECTANLMLDKLVQAYTACSDAIQAIEVKVSRGRKYRMLTSVAYSNRAIVRVKQGDDAGALADFKKALLVDDNKLVQANLSVFKSLMPEQSSIVDQIVSD